MGIFSRKKKDVEERNIDSYALNFTNWTSYNPNRAMLLSAVYRCVEVISDSVAELPIKVYSLNNEGYSIEQTKHPLQSIVNKEPNERMTRFTFMKLMVASMLLKGNAYAFIERINGQVKSLTYIPSDLVLIKGNVPFGKIHYEVSGFGKVQPENMIHLLNFTYDGINGISTLQHSKNTLGLGADLMNTSDSFFRSGANLSGILKVESSLTTKQKEDIKKSWGNAFNGAGGANNGIAVLEGNMSYTPIQVSPADAEMLAFYKMNVVDICRYFGVSPVKAFDLEHSSYSTIEATQLSFLTDTLQPLLEKIELEFERKLFNPAEKERMDIKFDTSTLLRTDKTALATYYKELFNIGVMTPNEIRKDLDLNKIDGGDNSFLQVNITTMDKIINQPLEDNKTISNQLKDNGTENK